MENEPKKPVPPYLSFKTFTSFIDGLAVNMPTRIDKTLMKSLSGGAQSALIGALDYFHLKDGVKPNDRLVNLTEAQGPDRAPIWNEMVHDAYTFLFTEDFDLKRATQGELDEKFRGQGVSGETINKCVAFFMSAAREAGLALSPHFKTIKTRAPRGSGRQARKKKSDELIQQHPPNNGTVTSGSTKTVHFKSGGTATLAVSVDVVALSPADRKALFEWIDAMSEYEERAATEGS
jgi:hypothetical protein